MDNKSQDNNIFILIKSFFVQMCVYVYVCRQSYQLSITSEQSLLHLRNQVLAAPGFLLHSQIFALSLTNLTIQTRYLESRYYLFPYIFLMRCLRPVLKSSSTVSGRLRPRLHWAENWTRSQPRGVAAQHGFWEQRGASSLSSASFLQRSTIKQLMFNPDLASRYSV